MDIYDSEMKSPIYENNGDTKYLEKNEIVSTSSELLLNETKSFVSQLENMTSFLENINDIIEKENSLNWDKECDEMHLDIDQIIFQLIDVKNSLANFHRMWKI